MREYVILKVREVLDLESGTLLSRAYNLAIGFAYKKNVSDMCESPAIDIVERLVDLGAEISVCDPYFKVLSGFRKKYKLSGCPTISVEGACDAVLILTDHDNADYQTTGDYRLPIVYTRNVIACKTNKNVRVFKA